MSDFSESQIEDAKRRVEQMRRRANNYTNSENKTNDDNKKESQNLHIDNSNNSNLPFGIDNIFKSLGLGNNDENSKGSGLILALILVLSYEKADSMLILALLYILL